MSITIAALSDMHGILPKLSSCNLVCICGDIFPTTIERNIQESERWFNSVFATWIKTLPCQFVVMIPGNHCLFLEKQYKSQGKVIIPKSIETKCVCLIDEEFVYDGIHLYGTPWVTNLPRWAFNTEVPNKYFENIPYDCDILLSHHAPDRGKLGTSFPDTEVEKNYGSIELAKAIEARTCIKFHFCGHIHTGVHNGVNIGNTKSYNVSILDEQYLEAFPVTYVEY